ncbi:umecyanin-like [Argentina anserina]|uniref:umecyanin-like n=1 Tax=Argentina anserina TaxID=57926 RepID=UPI0021768B9F|nr:umecyanin-like [Potentilla anserina]
MGKAVNVLVAVIGLAAIFLHRTEADEIEHNLVWTIPSGGAGEYAAWAAAHPFQLNYAAGGAYDSITFDFKTGEQDIAAVTKEDFDSCTTTDPIWIFSEAINYAPGYAGTYYFTCTFAGHCTKGQKIAITWANSTAPAPAPCPSSTATTSSALPLKFRSKRVKN